MQTNNISSKSSSKNSMLLNVATVVSPLILICIIVIFSDVLGFYLRDNLSKYDFLLFETLKMTIGFSPPFIIASAILFLLVYFDAKRIEIAVFSVSMLLPASIVSVYWISKYLFSPFALMVLLFINFFIVVFGALIGFALCKDIRNKINEATKTKK